MKLSRNRLVAGLLVTVGAVASLVFAAQTHATVFNGYDCTNNSIIKCGAYDFNTHSTNVNILRQKYDASSEVQKLYAHFGMSSANIHSTLYTGTVYKNGTVVVNGKTVATNAQSVGRFQDDGTGYKASPFTVAGHTYYKASTQHRFGFDGESAYVMFNSDGQFVGAIIKCCGNPIPATPVKPKPPVYTCTSLTATGVQNMEHDTLKFNFQTKATASGGATVKSYSYNFGDGSKATTGATTSHTYAKAGTYTASVTVTFSLSHEFGTTSTKTASCKVTVKPVKNVVKPAEVACTALTLKKISDTTYGLSATASATPGVPYKQQAGSISGYTYTVKDANGKVVKTINKAAGLPMQNSTSGNFILTPGNYTAQVVVHSNVGDKTGSQCTVKICVPQPPKTIQVCRLSDHQIVTINENDYTSSKYSKDLSQCQPVQVCDTTTGTLTSVYPSQIDGKRYTTDLSKCQKVTVCDLTTHQIVTISKSEANNSRYTTDLSQCQPVQVCDTTTGTLTKVYPSQVDNKRYTTDLSKCYVQVCDTNSGTIVTVLKSEANADHYTTDLSQCTKVQVCDLTTHQMVTVTKSQAESNSNYTSDVTQCQPVKVCDTTTGKVVEVFPSQIDHERYTTDMTKCTPVTPPVTPPTTPPAPTTPIELPHTGASDVIMSLFGAGSLIAAVSYYIASRRALS